MYYKQGQDEAVAGHLISICLNELEDSDPVYRIELSTKLRESFTIFRGAPARSYAKHVFDGESTLNWDIYLQS